MKKSIVILVLSVILFSCSGGSQQVSVVKDYLKTNQEVSDKELEGFQFEQFELLGKDAYSKALKVYSKRNSEYHSESTSMIIDTLTKSKKFDIYKEKTFYNVIAYRMAGNDTVAKTDIILTDNNKIFNVIYLK